MVSSYTLESYYEEWKHLWEDYVINMMQECRVRSFQKQWNKLEGLIDTEGLNRYEKLVIQESDAIWWSGCLFTLFSNLFKLAYTARYRTACSSTRRFEEDKVRFKTS